jgi:hypothetical protein
MINVAFLDKEIKAFGFSESIAVLMRQLGMEVAPVEEDLIPDIIAKYPERDFRRDCE